MTKKLGVMVIGVCVLTISLTGCNEKKDLASAELLKGYWQSEIGYASFTESYAYIPMYGTGNWTVNGNTLKLIDSITENVIATFTCSFSNNNNQLTLVNNHTGDSTVYTRQ
jgi:hypothetical protein